ncbi:MAG: CorA family divalent cation transporter [Steroidobacteraceae bacterium]
MLNIYPPIPADLGIVPAKPIWIDLLRPTPEEEGLVESEHGLRIPTHAQLQEIETSSRLRIEGQSLVMSMPLGLQDNRFASGPLPLGFVLTPDILVTVRYCDIHAFPDVQAALIRNHIECTSASVFASLLEAMVDFAADRLEQISADLGAVSQRVFGSPAQPLPQRPRFNSAMQQNLIGVGQTGELLSRIRESLLGLGRIASFATETASWLPAEVHARLKTVRRDLVSLSDYESHLSGKTQFLQDAVLGFINTPAERHLQGSDDCLGSRGTADPDRQYLWHELPQYPRVRMEVRLRVGPECHRPEHHPADSLVQMAQVVVKDSPGG